MAIDTGPISKGIGIATMGIGSAIALRAMKDVVEEIPKSRPRSRKSKKDFQMFEMPDFKW